MTISIHALHNFPDIHLHKWDETHALHINKDNCLLETEELIRLAQGAHFLSQIIQQYLFQLQENGE